MKLESSVRKVSQEMCFPEERFALRPWEVEGKGLWKAQELDKLVRSALEGQGRFSCSEILVLLPESSLGSLFWSHQFDPENILLILSSSSRRVQEVRGLKCPAPFVLFPMFLEIALFSS